MNFEKTCNLLQLTECFLAGFRLFNKLLVSVRYREAPCINVTRVMLKKYVFYDVQGMYFHKKLSLYWAFIFAKELCKNTCNTFF